MLKTADLLEKHHITFKETLIWLWGFWRNLQYRTIILLIMTPITMAIRVYMPIFIYQIFNELSSTEAINSEIIIQKSWELFLFGLVHFILYFSMQSLRAVTNVRLENDFRVRLFRYLVRLGQNFFQRFPTGDLITRLIDDVSERKLSWFACSGIFRFYEAVLKVIGCLFFMFQLSVTLTIITIFPLTGIVIFYLLSSRITIGYTLKTQTAISKLNSFLTSTFDGIRIVKSYNQEARQEAEFDEVVQNQLKKELDLVKASTWLYLSYSRFSEAIIIFIFMVGGWFVIQDQLSFGTLVAFNAYVFMLVWPMVDIGQFFIRGRGAGVCVERIQELENYEPEIVNHQIPQTFPESSLNLAFQQVSYTFPNGKYAFKDITFNARQGEVIALAGAVGSGKSSFIQLVPRIIDPSHGQVLLNGEDLPLYEVSQLRQKVGFVTQTPTLFSDTIRNNIYFGRKDISEDVLKRAIQIAQLEKEIQSFNEGLETKIGQRGVKISGGQKQRIAIARSLVHQPRILVLDDCTSALDAETEALLWQQLYEYMPNMIVFLITHRVSTLKRASQIIVLQDGELVDTGTHDELIERSDYYRGLYL